MDEIKLGDIVVLTKEQEPRISLVFGFNGLEYKTGKQIENRKTADIEFLIYRIKKVPATTGFDYWPEYKLYFGIEKVKYLDPLNHIKNPSLLHIEFTTNTRCMSTNITDYKIVGHMDRLVNIIWY